VKHINNFINGEWVEPVNGSYMDVYEPATGDVYCRLAASGKEDVDQAVSAAKNAFPEWADTSKEKRSEILKEIANGIEAELHQLASLESRDNGKPVWLAKSVDIPRAVTNFHVFADAILKFEGEVYTSKEFGENTIHLDPLGVVGCISPWNLPLYLFSWKIAPAIAAGNCVVGKPSELTPYTANELSRICKDAGLPNGVLNIVHGEGKSAGAAITEHPDVKAVSFTGGTETGKSISAVAAPAFKKLSLELGGKNPNIIFADCDFEKMMDTTLKSSFSNQGQICLCGSRIMVEKPIYESFKKEFRSRTKKLQVGDPTDDNSNLGAVVSKDHSEKILKYIDLARQEGGNILEGGKKAKVNGRCENGWFIQPTIIEGLDEKCRTNQEEIFGPVVTIMPFESEEEAVRLANATPYGLSASVWTENDEKGQRMAKKIDVGVVWLNCWMVRDLRTPFGGMKQSGLGREGGKEALRFFTEAKNVCRK